MLSLYSFPILPIQVYYNQADGLGFYVSRITLPSLLFQAMATLDLSGVNWPLLAGVVLAEAAVFLIVAVASILLGRPVNWGTAGLFAIFATQSNNFALGYPMVRDL